MRNIVLLSVFCLFGWAFAESPTVSQHYRLATGDRISINVFGEPELSVEFKISDDEAINYPFLGVLPIAQMTTRELENTIADGLRGEYLLDPVVQVQITHYRPFYIHGEVKKPGSYPFQPGLTVIQAVALAGGFTDRASDEAITIYRVNSDTESESVSVNQAFLPGDTITVGRRFF